MATTLSNRLRDALLLETGGVITLVGSGGKTSLMFRLARELSGEGGRVLTTTTTRIHVPTAAQSPEFILAASVEEILERAAEALSRNRHITVAAGRSADADKLAGLAPEAIERLRAAQICDWIIVEADGAAGRPLKAPADYEPVIPSCTEWLVATAGLRGLSKPLTDQWVFRAEVFARITGLPPGAAVTEQAIAAALAHEQGVLKGAPGGCRRLVFLNQADEPREKDAGLRIAGLLRQFGGSRIQRTIVGQVLGEPPVSAVFDL